jgi:voltage-gated potassium channel
MEPLKKIYISAITLIFLISGGTLGYSIIEGWPLFESLYMTTITLATVGFNEVHKLSHQGQIFTMLLIIFGVGYIAYTLTSSIQFIVEGQLRHLLGRKKLQNKINKLKDHYIVCGYGRIGRQICKQLAKKPLPFIVIDNNPAVITRIGDDNFLHIAGDATEDEVLMQAGIERAKGLITAVTTDSANVFIILSARGINRALYILARASNEGAEKKLLSAGANRVVSPYAMGANRMANAILRPSVVDFLEIAIGHDNLELQLEEIPVAEDSSLVGRPLMETGIRSELGVIIIGIKINNKMTFNPSAETVIEAGHILIALGEQPEIKKLELISANKTYE